MSWQPMQAQSTLQDSTAGLCNPLHIEGATGESISARACPVTVRKRLGVVPVALLIFYNVSGGPFGSEDALASAGPFLAILGFIIMPLVWSVPEAMLTAELATAIPDDGGYSSWVTAAFGPFWGFQEGILSLIAGIMDSAIYPSMFVAHFRYIVCPLPSDKDIDGVSCPIMDTQLAWFMPTGQHICVLVFIFLLSFCNWRSLEIVGKVAVVLTIFLLLPFCILCIVGIPKVQPSAWLRIKPADSSGGGDEIDWIGLLNTLFWNLNYWDTVSTLAGEVNNTSETLPRGMFFAMILVVCSYVFPLAVCSAALPAGQPWKIGFFASAGETLGGALLMYGIVISATLSTMGQFLSEQAANSHQLLGMANLGLIPSLMAVRSRRGVPAWGLLLTTITVLPLAMINVEDLIERLNGVYCLAELLEFAAFLRLRLQMPELRRPYRVPLNFAGCVMMLAAPSAMCVVLLGAPYVASDWMTVGFVLGCTVLGPLLYFAMAALRFCCPQFFLYVDGRFAQSDETVEMNTQKNHMSCMGERCET